MIAGILQSAIEQIPKMAGLRKATDFFCREGWVGLSEGRFEIDGDSVWGVIQSYETDPTLPHEFEVHRRHIDLHFIVSGEETIYWIPAECLSREGAYDRQRDVWLSKLQVSPDQVTPLRLRAGDLAVFFPSDGHMPRRAGNNPGTVKKILVKVRTYS
jgi:YhcH/YjgK/YiaL family protein